MKVRVFKKGEAGIDENELDRLLADAGCVQIQENELAQDEEIEDSEDEPEQEPDGADDQATDANGEDEEEEDVTLIVVLTPECVDDPQLDGAVNSVIKGGGRAVGVWPKAEKAGNLPPILDKIGSGAVPWDPEKLAGVLSDQKSVWDTSAGTPRPQPVTKRNKC